MTNLTLLQRVWRRIALLGGSYTHPDGSIELDFEASAGVDHYRDSEEVKSAKVEGWWRRHARQLRLAGAVYVGIGVYLVTRPGAATWERFLGGGLVLFGLLEVGRH